MPLRLGPGPVFVYEWLTASRRWQTYAVRAGYVGAILVGLAFVSHKLRYDFPGEVISLQELARYGESMYLTIATIGLALVLLAAPATTAGAVCLDKARGTLDHTLVTDLSNAEIVLGKLGVRLIPVLGLIACTLPVLALVGLLGGIDPMAAVGSFLTATGCAVASCSLAMTLSVWGRKTHEVLLATYMVMVVWLGLPLLVALAMYWLGSRAPPPVTAPVFWQIVADTNPIYLVCAPYADPGRVGLGTFAGFLAGCLAAGAGLIGLSTARIRRVAQRQAGRPAAGPRRRWLPRLRWPWWLPTIPGPSLDDNPVAWREWHRMRPSRMMRAAWGLYAAAGVLGLLWTLTTPPGPFAETGGGVVGFQVALGLLLLSVGSATSLAEERARGSLDILLSTPMSTRSILAGKWWGGFRQTWRVAVWPAVIGAMVLADSGRIHLYALLLGWIAACVAAIMSLGLAMATWVSRPGRAVAACVAVYVAGSIGGVGLIVLLFRPEPFGRSLIIGCPALGALAGTVMISARSMAPWRAGEYQVAAMMWIGAYLAMARWLFGATVRSFDRCLGRMPEGGEMPLAARRRRAPAARLRAGSGRRP